MVSFSSRRPDSYKFVLCNLKGSIQKLLLFYQKVFVDTLHQNLKQMKLNKRVSIKINRSLTEDIIITKNRPLGFFVLETNSKINVRQETMQKTKTMLKISKKRQSGILNRYDFAYDGRDTVDQVGKIAPGIIKNTSSEINDIA